MTPKHINNVLRGLLLHKLFTEVRTVYREVGLSLCECVKMITKTPAKVMGLDLRGEIKAGYIAHLVFFDDDI